MSKYTVLVVDDSLVVRESLKSILCVDYNLIFAQTGEEAIKIAHDKLPDIILLDVIMPHTNGFEVITSLRNSSDTKDIPIIMLTSISDKDCEANGLLAGANDFIHKPINGLVVKLRVENQTRILSYIRAIEQLQSELSKLKKQLANTASS